MTHVLADSVSIKPMSFIVLVLTFPFLCVQRILISIRTCQHRRNSCFRDMVVDIVFQRKVLILISSKLTWQFITLRSMWRPYLNNASGIIAQLNEWALHTSQNYLHFISFSFLSKIKLYLCFCLHKPQLCTRTRSKENETWLRDDMAENGQHHRCLSTSIDIKDGKDCMLSLTLYFSLYYCLI